MRRELTSDPELAEEYALRRDSAIAARRAAVAEHISASSREYAYRQRGGGAKVVRLQGRRLMAVAASALLAVSVATFALWQLRSPDADALAYAYFEPAAGLPTTLGVATDGRFTEAMIDYKLGDFNAAAQRWQAMAAEGAGGDTLHFFLGVALLADRQPAAAALQLDNVQGLRADEARWYAALATLAEGRKDEAKRRLGVIARTSTSRTADAQSLLGELE